MNLQSQEYEYNTQMLLRPVRQNGISIRPDKAQVTEAVAEIRKHRRIAIRVGGGAVAAGEVIKSLAERVGAAVIMGPVAMDVIESDFSLNVGPAGSNQNFQFGTPTPTWYSLSSPECNDFAP